MSSNLDQILKIDVPIVVRVGERKMPLSEVLRLVPGSMIELPKHAEDELDLLVNNREIGVGTAVKVGENFGLRISYIGDVKLRIAAVGPEAPSGPSDAEADKLADALLADQM